MMRVEIKAYEFVALHFVYEPLDSLTGQSHISGDMGDGQRRLRQRYCSEYLPACAGQTDFSDEIITNHEQASVETKGLQK